MNPTRHLRRLAAVLAGLACTWLVLAVAAPAAFAVRYPIPGGPAGAVTLPPVPPGLLKHPPLPGGHVTGPVYQVHTVVTGGMPGWTIALIAIGAALFAAAAAVLADRTWSRRKSAPAPEPSVPGADVLSVS